MTNAEAAAMLRYVWAHRADAIKICPPRRAYGSLRWRPFAALAAGHG